MKRTWTIIGAKDVPVSFKWYQSLFGQPETPPAHDYFGHILDRDEPCNNTREVIHPREPSLMKTQHLKFRSDDGYEQKKCQPDRPIPVRSVLMNSMHGRRQICGQPIPRASGEGFPQE